MKIKRKTIKEEGIKFFIEVDGKEIGRAFLYILYNDLHKKPFGLLEDVYINEDLRGQGDWNSIAR